MSDLSERPGFQESMTHPLRRAVCDLRAKHNLTGCVLISFYGDRVGVSSSGCTDEFGAHMITLGDRILAAIDDGQFDPGDKP